MAKPARLLTRFALQAAFFAAMAAPVAAAEGDQPTTGMWMAASATDPGVSTKWGRLMLKDGVLAFRSANLAWTLAAGEIKRVAISEQSDRLLVLESAAGETYYVAILGQNLLVESPRKAMQIIQRVAQTPAARRER